MINRTMIAWHETEVVVRDIREERAAQDQKWGSQREQSYPVWNTILSEEVGEAAKEVLEKRRDKLRMELVQVAAVAVAWIEAIDAERGEFR